MNSSDKPVIIAGMKADASETSIRTVLLPHLKEAEGGSAVFLSELVVDGFSRRADVVVANGRLSAFEIKSSADRLSRLEGQIQSYKQNFEEITIVCSVKHLDGVRRLATPGVGILTVSHDGQIAQVRRARYGKITKAAWLQYLPVAELRKLLRSHGGRTPAVADRRCLLEACFRLRAHDIREYALAYIKLRDDRNEKLRAAREEKRRLRAYYAPPQIAQHPEWLGNFSEMGSIKAIPRKIS